MRLMSSAAPAMVAMCVLFVACTGGSEGTATVPAST